MDLSTFDFEEHAVRAFQDDRGNAWFVAADVCFALGISRTDDGVSRLDDDEKGAGSIRTPGGTQEMTIINESGLYSLILGSRKPEAKRFKKWVTSEVLPSIRKTGAYSMGQGGAASQEELAMQSVMKLIATQKLPMVDAALAMTVMAKGAHELAGVPIKDALSGALHDFGQHAGISTISLQSELGGRPKPTSAASAASKAWAMRLRWRNERERQRRRLNILDLVKGALDVEYARDGVTLSDDEWQMWQEWSRLPAHLRCLRVLWAYELRGQALIVWWMMEQHRRQGGLGEAYAVPTSAQDIYDVLGEMLGACRVTISIEMKRALERELLFAHPQAPHVIRTLWLNVSAVLQNLRGLRYPDEDILLLNALLGDRAEAVVMEHLLSASHKATHVDVIPVNCSKLAKDYDDTGVQVGERRLRRAVERLVQKGYAHRDAGIDEARYLRLGAQLPELHAAMDAFHECFGLRLIDEDHSVSPQGVQA